MKKNQILSLLVMVLLVFSLPFAFADGDVFDDDFDGDVFDDDFDDDVFDDFDDDVFDDDFDDDVFDDNFGDDVFDDFDDDDRDDDFPDDPPPPPPPPPPVNLDPVAIGTFDPVDPMVYEEVVFDGSQSYDPDGTITLWEWDFESDGIIDAIGQTVSFIFDSIGTFFTTLTVTDNDGATGSTTLGVTVGLPNNAPVIISNPVLNAVVGETYLYDVDAMDIDNDPLTFSLLEAPVWMTIDTVTGLITWKPTDEDLVTVTVMVTDGRGGFDTQKYTLLVTEEPVQVEEKESDLEVLFFAKIRPSSELVSAGSQISWLVELTNDGATDLEDIVIMAGVYDFGDRFEVGPFDLDEEETQSATLTLDVPSWVESGLYDVRFVAQDQGDAKVVEHRIIEVR